MAKNIHRVQKKQWKKFGKSGQAMFNRLWSSIHNEIVMPSDKPLAKDDFQIMRWNVCFEAAYLAKEILQDFGCQRGR